MHSHNSQTLARKQLIRDRARFMRHNPTPSERLLFQALRGKRLGVSFRRQQVLGNAIVDLLAHQAKLVVEIDGDVYHAQRTSADEARDRKLVRAGYTVLRIPASVVETDLSRAVSLVKRTLAEALAA